MSFYIVGLDRESENSPRASEGVWITLEDGGFPNEGGNFIFISKVISQCAAIR